MYALFYSGQEGKEDLNKGKWALNPSVPDVRPGTCPKDVTIL